MIDPQTPLASVTFVAFDTETTGIGPGCKLVEIAGAKFRGGEFIAKFEALIDPEMEMPDEITAVHQITNEMVRGQPKAGEALRKFFEFAEGAVLVAHNATFDAAMVGLELTRARLPAPINPILDTLQGARRCYPGHSHSLDALIELIGLPPQATRHRAYADAELVLHLVRKMIETVGGGEKPYAALIEMTGQESLRTHVLAFPALAPPLRYLEEACRDGKKANIHLDAGGTKLPPKTVNPRLCYGWKGVDYLEAWVPEERALRTYRIDKIVKAEKGASSGFLF